MAKQNLANTRAQRTKDKETLKKEYRRIHEMAVATTQQADNRRSTGEDTLNKPPRQRPSEEQDLHKILSPKMARESKNEAQDGGKASTE